MGGGFTPLPTLLPQAQLGAANGTQPVLGKVSDCLKQLLYFPNPEKSTSHRFPGALGANLERFWSPTWPQTSSIMQPSWVSSADSSSKYRQPRSTVNKRSRATSPGPADHSKTSKNRSQDASIWRFLSIPFQNGLEALPRGLLETIFFEMYDFGCPTWGLKIAKRRDHLKPLRFFLPT